MDWSEFIDYDAEIYLNFIDYYISGIHMKPN